jgi:hypothetical protein
MNLTKLVQEVPSLARIPDQRRLPRVVECVMVSAISLHLSNDELLLVRAPEHEHTMMQNRRRTCMPTGDLSTSMMKIDSICTHETVVPNG